jgi:hypothetical protein
MSPICTLRILPTIRVQYVSDLGQGGLLCCIRFVHYEYSRLFGSSIKKATFIPSVMGSLVLSRNAINQGGALSVAKPVLRVPTQRFLYSGP